MADGFEAGRQDSSLQSVWCEQTFYRQAKARPLRAAPGKPQSITAVTSEPELQCKLYQPGIAHMLYLTKRAAQVRNVAINAVKLRMVPNVKEIAAEFHLKALGKLRGLVKAYVPVVESGTATDGAGRVTNGAQCGAGYGGIVVKDSGIESKAGLAGDSGGTARARHARARIQFFERGDNVRLAGRL